MSVCVFFLFPETKGKSLEEMEFIFGERDYHQWEMASSNEKYYH
jgi:hypothetical protein